MEGMLRHPLPLPHSIQSQRSYCLFAYLEGQLLSYGHRLPTAPSIVTPKAHDRPALRAVFQHLVALTTTRQAADEEARARMREELNKAGYDVVDA